MKLTIDFETRSKCDLKRCGAWVYAEHPSTEIMCLAFKEDDGPARIWASSYFKGILETAFAHYDLPLAGEEDLFAALASADIIEAHNAGFERALWESICVTRHGWPLIPKEKWRCSAAKAAAFALPRSLEGAGEALGLLIQKDREGHRIMLKLCKPRRPTQADHSPWHEKPEDLIKLFSYCIKDVEAEHALSKALPDLSSKELKVWRLDQEINRRGIYVDAKAARAAVELIGEHEDKLLGEVREITKGAASSVKQVGKMVEWMKARGVNLPDLTKAAVISALERKDLPPEVRRLLEIRQSLGKSSTAKYQAFIDRANRDGRIRDTLLYHAASTGRWGGKGVQPQNLPRGHIKDVDLCLELVRAGRIDAIELLFGDPMAALSSCIRGIITAAPGHELICADFAAIEARVIAWLAGESKVLEAFCRKLDLYKVAAMKIYKKPYERITKEERQIGKIATLALGFMGGVGAFQSMAKNYGVKVSDEEAQEIVDAWREGHPKIKAFWQGMERCAIKAVETGKVTIWHGGLIKWGLRGEFLHCRLPSGRVLSYCRPWVEVMPTPWGGERKALRYWGIDTYSKKWSRQQTFGGRLVENCVQGTARDLMAEAMLRVEEAGYPVVLSVHDEIVSEVPGGFGSLEEYEHLMATAPDWAEGCPIEAKGWRGKRYRK